MAKNLISIIVPVYNAEKYLSRCIESILNQTYKNIQLIIINDGSTDKSLEIIEKYAANDNRIVLVDKENTGVSDSRNRGLDIATGEYIGFVDADDYVESEMYEILYQEILSDEADICCCGYQQKFADYRYDIAIDEKLVLNGTEAIISQYLRQDIRNGIFDGNWNKLFKKKCIENIRYENIKHGEDILFQYKAFLNCDKMVCIPNLLYHYVSNENSATNMEFNKNKLSIIDVAREIKEITIARYPHLEELAYAFNLTWNIALLQDYYDGKINTNIKSVVENIREDFINNRKKYWGNKYSKRLDQYYYIAFTGRVMRPAIVVRKIVRRIKPSRDRVIISER